MLSSPESAAGRGLMSFFLLPSYCCSFSIRLCVSCSALVLLWSLQDGGISIWAGFSHVPFRLSLFRKV